ncbi:MAG: O-antigen ligase family protein [Acidobacteriota bacterium]|nr:O-antigen ligase family protein [Acidobacteriota bacterium]
MNAFTKGVVIASTLVAAFTQLYLATRLTYLELMGVAAAGFAVALIAGLWRPGLVTTLLLSVVYVAPAIHVALGRFESASLEIAWALPLLGLILAGRDGWRWNVPPRFRWPLVAWALVIAASWPIVFLRELDFRLWILPMRGAANTSIGITPWEAAHSVAYWALVNLLGLLWFDRLFGWYANGGLAMFRARAIYPLATGALVACLISFYQGAIDIQFLNPHQWPYMRRAAGTLGDANTLGAVAALWGPVLVLLARRFSQPWPVIAGITGVALAALGVAMSGSRSALLGFTLGIGAVVVESVRPWRRSAGPSRAWPTMKQLTPIMAGFAALVLVAWLAASGSAVTSVVSRGALRYMPFYGEVGIRQTLFEIFWERYGYGTSAVQMIKEYPLSGTGIGSFHTLVNDFSVTVNGWPLVPDNAQSWYRHMLAELGVLGSLPWIAWCAVFGWTLFSRPPPSADRFAVGVLRATLAAFGVISMMGMPGQSLPVALTFWTLAFWFVLEHGTHEEARPWSRAVWGATFVLALAHAGLTYADARGDLLPRHRSMRFDWPYRYGLSNLEPSADGTPGRRWTELRSLAVIPVKGQTLKFVGWIDHPDADERPVHVRIWADSRLVWDDDLRRSAAIFLDIKPSEGKTHLTIETEISRMWRPADFGREDRRVLGLSVRDWTWDE